MTGREFFAFIAIMAVSAATVALYGSPQWRTQPCEARWELCAAQLDRAGQTAADWRGRYLQEIRACQH